MADEVSVPGRGGEGVSPGEQRASHDDRDRIVEVLKTAAADGRLTADELDERVGAALTARTHGELAHLTTDLSAIPGTAVIGPAPKPKDVIRIECHSSIAKRDGRWLVPPRIEVRVTSGHVTLDFTHAVISQPTVQVDAEISTGGLTLVTKPGVVVDTDDVAVRASSVQVRAPSGPEVPVMLRIEVSGKVRSGYISAGPPRSPESLGLPRPPRRTFWQWLLRRPRPPAITS
jgi:hypothetical protein